MVIGEKWSINLSLDERKRVLEHFDFADSIIAAQVKETVYEGRKRLSVISVLYRIGERVQMSTIMVRRPDLKPGRGMWRKL